jgi:hypothetical protein
MTTDPAAISYTIPLPAIQEQIDINNALRAENAALRETLIDVTGQRNALQQELYQALQERVS